MNEPYVHGYHPRENERLQMALDDAASPAATSPSGASPRSSIRIPPAVRSRPFCASEIPSARVRLPGPRHSDAVGKSAARSDVIAATCREHDVVLVTLDGRQSEVARRLGFGG